MKKTIQIIALAIAGFTVNAQAVRDSKMKPLDKTVVLQPALDKTKFITPAPPAPPASSSVNDYFMSLPRWGNVTSGAEVRKQVSGPQPSDEYEAPNQPTKKQVSNCTTYSVDINTVPEKIVTMNPNFNTLWLGALVQGNGLNKGIGSLAELPLRKRNNLRISSSLYGAGATSAEVANPDAGSVRQAIDAMMSAATISGLAQSPRTSFRVIESSSITESLFQLGISANFFDATAKIKLQTHSTANQHTYMAYFYQNAFTVTMQNPTSPGDFFTSALTMADIEQQKNQGTIGPANIPVCLSTINYGRILLVSIVSTSSYNDISAALNASYNGGNIGGSVTLSYKNQQVLNNSQFEVKAIGGPEAGVAGLIKTGQIANYFSIPTTLTVYQPISYEFTNIIDKTPARFLEATHYEVTECTPVPNVAHPEGHYAQLQIKSLTIKGNWDWQLGDDNKMDLYGHLEVDGTQVWSVPLNKDILSPAFTFINKNNNYGDGEVVNLDPNNSPLLPPTKPAAPPQDAVYGKELRNDNDGFLITGLFGDWDLVTSAESPVNMVIPFSMFKNDASQYERLQTFEIRKNIETDHPASIIVTYVVHKNGEIVRWTTK
jgi:thiol-activated cytolysin